MDDDEVATVSMLKSYREAMSKLIERRQGRIVNRSSDSLLVEFASVVVAVQCASEI
jgi:adenylate cyclase